MSTRTGYFLAVAAMALRAHAANPPAPAPAPLPASATTATLPAGAQKIPADRLSHYWLLAPESVQGNAPNSGAGLDTPTCVAVSYLIEKNGTTSHVKLEHVVPPGPLGKVAANVVAGMRFAPTRDNAGKEPVFTYVVMPFNAPGAESTAAADRAERKRVLDPCDMAAFMATAK